MKFLSLPTALLIVILTVVPPVFAQSATLTATVQPNPLDVQVSAPPSVGIGDWFNIEVTITNKGTRSVTKTFAKIHTSSEIKVRGKKKRIGTLTSGPTKLIWQAKANEAGNYVIQVNVEGFLGTKKISAGDSAVIEATNSILPSWFRLLFGI